jgi:hypothetical protein
MSEKIKIDFALHCWARRDKDAGIYVGYIPTLRVYSQGRDDAELRKALTSAAEMFIVTCYGRGVLGRALQERGMTEASGAAAVAAASSAKAADGEYISVSEYQSTYETEFTINVPIELIASQRAGGECRPQ